ncbi:HD family hydrolase [Kribbella sp. NPDC056345]|uniref:HD domain-containing protein n=1 Tax=Kribbella sp. NPDC056345 TaxID=3345789 RepID=UPI0035DE564A
MTNHQSPVDENRLLDCFAELHNLVKIPRTGWIMAGVREPEAVSDHCYEAAMMAYVLRRYIAEPVDMGKVLTMLLFHEVGESRLTDLPRRGSVYVKQAKGTAESAIVRDVIGDVAPELLETLEEFHRRETIEAKLAEACEELQILFAALMYAKERNGDLTEYRLDVAKYDSYGIEIADKLAKLVGTKLDEYLGDAKYWELGYRRQ